MPTTGSAHPGSPATARAERDRVSSAYVNIVRLATTAPSKPAFYSQALAHAAGAFESPFAVLYLRSSAEVIEDEYHDGPSDPGFWRPPVQDFMTEAIASGHSRARLLSAKDSSVQLGLIATPMFDASGEIIGGVALVARMTEQDVRQRVATFESLVALLSHVGIASDAARQEATETRRSEDQSRVESQALARSAVFESAEELAYSLTNSLRNRLGCEHVALGLVARQHVRLLSISGLDDLRRQSPGMVQIRLAMEECLDARRPVVCQQSPEILPDQVASEHRLHKQWHNAARGAAVASIPLRVGKTIVAVLSTRLKYGASFTAEDLQQIREAVEPFAPALLLIRRAQRGLASHTMDALREAAAALLGPRSYGWKLTVAACVLLAGWFAFGTLTYEITVPSSLQPAQRRHVAMPYDGIVSEVHAGAGDTVTAGQVLCELDHRDLDLRRAELRAELAAVEQEMQRCLAADSPVDVQLCQANARLLRTRIALIERRIEHARIRSPLDGVVLRGDLDDKAGATFAQGAPLYQIAPTDAWELELAVPEWAASHVKPGLPGRFATRARPDIVEVFRVGPLRPQAELRKNRNVFVATADIDVAAGWLRPGMEGVARIRIGPRPVWWVTFHRLIDYLRLNVWL